MKDDELLTREELACLKTALALVIVKRRFLSGNTNDDHDDEHSASANASISLIPGLDSSTLQQQQQQPDERWALHLSHMMDLAVRQVEDLAQQPPRAATARHATAGTCTTTNSNSSSLRLDSLATHLACQLESWANESPLATSEWIRSRLQLLGLPGNTTTSMGVVAVVWWSVLLSKPTPLARLLIPLLIEHVVTAMSHTTTTAHPQAAATALGHWWNLLDAAIPYAPTETCQDAVLVLMNHHRDTSNGVATSRRAIPDLAVQYVTYSSKQKGNGSHLLLAQWAVSDLVQLLMARLSRESSSAF